MQLARDETAPYDNNLSRFGRGSVIMLEDGPGMLDDSLMNDGIGMSEFGVGISAHPCLVMYSKLDSVILRYTINFINVHSKLLHLLEFHPRSKLWSRHLYKSMRTCHNRSRSDLPLQQSPINLTTLRQPHSKGYIAAPVELPSILLYMIMRMEQVV